jgi:hypothetical protein
MNFECVVVSSFAIEVQAIVAGCITCVPIAGSHRVPLVLNDVCDDPKDVEFHRELTHSGPNFH